MIRPLGLSSLFVALVASSSPAWADNCGATQNMPLGPGANPWKRWELPLASATNYVDGGQAGKGNPSRDLVLQATLTKCNTASLVRYKSLGFWYGLAADGTTLDAKAFRLRAALPAGTWQWELSCTRRSTASSSTPDCASDPVLNGKGRFEITGSPGNNFLYKNGFPQVSGDKRYLTLGSSKKFFWLGDAAWNANILMSYNNWTSYVTSRAAPLQGLTGSQFTVVQLATAPKAAGGTDLSGNPPFDAIGPNCAGDGPGSCFRMNPRFWKGVDDKIEYANQKGLVVLYAGFIEPLQKTEPFAYDTVLTTVDEAKIFALSVAARYAGNFVIYSPGFDHKLQSNASIIDSVGSALGTDTSTWTARQLVTNHSAGGLDVSQYTTYLHGKAWLDFELYQSGTPGTSEADELTKMTDRAGSMAATLAAATPTKPVINGESVYPGQSSDSDWSTNHTPYRARQTAYVSMLSGAVGYSMGTCGVVDWGQGGLAGCNNSPTWKWNTDKPAFTANTMKVMKFIFQSVYWERLRSEPSRIQLATNQPPFKPYTKPALAYDGSSAILAYVPDEAAKIRIDFNAPRVVPGLAQATTWPATRWAYSWISPRDGSLWIGASPGLAEIQPGVFELTRPGCELQTSPCDAVDWVLKIVDKTKAQPAPEESVLQVSNEIGPFSGEMRVVATVIGTDGNPSSQIEIGGAGMTSVDLPRIASEPGGNSLVVWTSDGTDGSSLRGRIINSQGSPVTDELIIASGDVTEPLHPSVAALASGEFVVTWSGIDPDGSGPWIHYQSFDRLGSPLTDPLLAVDCDPVAGDFPQVAPLGGGGFAIGWEISEGAGIYVLQLDAYGNAVIGAHMAQGSGAVPILEAIDDSGFGASVSYGLYFPDGSSSGGNSINVVGEPSICR
jgi:hypothetical protein